MNKEEIPDELTCDICKDIFHDPIKLDPCKHTYCIKCIAGAYPNAFSCPYCRQQCTGYEHDTDLRKKIEKEYPNIEKQVVERKKKADQYQELVEAAQAHQEITKLTDRTKLENGKYTFPIPEVAPVIIPPSIASVNCVWNGWIGFSNICEEGKQDHFAIHHLIRNGFLAHKPSSYVLAEYEHVMRKDTFFADLASQFRGDEASLKEKFGHWKPRIDASFELTSCSALLWWRLLIIFCAILSPVLFGGLYMTVLSMRVIALFRMGNALLSGEFLLFMVHGIITTVLILMLNTMQNFTQRYHLESDSSPNAIYICKLHHVPLNILRMNFQINCASLLLYKLETGLLIPRLKSIDIGSLIEV